MLMSSQERQGPESRLGYLLKHVNARLTDLTTAALGPLGIDGRELGVVLAIDSAKPLSQLAVATRLGIDRTTMVAMLDTLESKGLITRRPLLEDRRRNVVELTPRGHTALAEGIKASDAAERKLLSGLDAAEGDAFRVALRAMLDLPVERAEQL